MAFRGTDADVLLIPSGVALLILPRMVSPLNGLKTMSLNSTAQRQLRPQCWRYVVSSYAKQAGLPLTLTRPVPWPIKPSEAHSRSYMQMHKPIF